jgi:hypothetical protein
MITSFLILTLMVVFSLNETYADINQGRVSGYIRDKDTDLAIPQAHVGGLGGGYPTDNNGYFDGLFTLGENTLYVTKEEYISEPFTVNVLLGQTVDVGIIYLQSRRGTISFTVRDNLTRRIIPNATVNFIRDGLSISQKVQANGQGTIYHDPGSQSITIEHAYFMPKTVYGISVTAKQDTNVGTIFLIPLEDYHINIVLEQGVGDIAVSRAGYGFYSIGNTIYRFPLSDGREAGFITFPANVSRMHCIDDTGYLYACVESEKKLYWIALSSFSIVQSKIYTEGPEEVIPLRAGQLILTMDYIEGSGHAPLVIIDSQTGTILDTVMNIVDEQPIVSPTMDGELLYITERGSPMSMHVYNVSHFPSTCLQTLYGLHPNTPLGLIISPDKTKLFHSHFQSVGIDLRTTDTFNLISSWNLGTYAKFLKRSPDGTQLWCVLNNMVTFLDIRTGSIIEQIDFGTPPIYVATYDAANYPYTVDESNKVALIIRGTSSSKQDIRIQRLSSPTSAGSIWPQYP